jgi:hypothetical protein
MPSKSKAQRNLMAAAAHNPAFAKKVGVPVAVAQEFNKADKGKKFGSGGMAKSDMKEDTKMDKAQDKAMIKKAFKQHDMQEHKGGKGTKLALKKGGVAKTVTKEMEYDYKSGKKSFRGTTAQRDAHAEKEGKIVAKHAAYDKAKGMKSGGSCSYASGGKVSQLAKANGIAVRGKTKGTMVAMRSGGKTKSKMC